MDFLQLVKPNEIVNQRLSLKEIGIGRMKQGPTVYLSRAIVRMGKYPDTGKDERHVPNLKVKKIMKFVFKRGRRQLHLCTNKSKEK